MRKISSLLRDSTGAMAIETAFVAPILAIMSLGTFEVGTMLSRQQELQSAASEAEAIILAAAASSGTNSATIRDIIKTSLGLRTDQVTLTQKFRCNTANALVLDASGCDSSKPIYQYIELKVTDSYAPFWTGWEIGKPFNYSVIRTVQVR